MTSSCPGAFGMMIVPPNTGHRNERIVSVRVGLTVHVFFMLKRSVSSEPVGSLTLYGALVVLLKVPPVPRFTSILAGVLAELVPSKLNSYSVTNARLLASGGFMARIHKGVPPDTAMSATVNAPYKPAIFSSLSLIAAKRRILPRTQNAVDFQTAIWQNL